MPHTTKQPPLFSIVIPTLNEELYLPQLLSDLSEQSFRNFEVIVVDGTSEDATIKTAEGFTKKLPLTIISVSKRNVSFQRNTGAKKARGKWVIFMDADNELPSFFLQGVAYQLEKKPETDVFTCWMDVKEDEDRALRYVLNLTIELYGLLPNPQAMGALIGCRAGLLREFAFDETQRYLEDGMFLRSLVQAGYVFRIFKEPRWFYSLRRVKKEGTLKLARSVAAYQFKYLLGGDFSKPHSTTGYPMLGGSYYDAQAIEGDDQSFQMLRKIQHFITSSSSKQLNQAKKLLQTIRDFEL